MIAHRFAALWLLAITFNVVFQACYAEPAAPEKAGPHASYAMQRGGTSGEEYWIFTPDEPCPSEAPVVVFLHGWAGMDPYLYGAWIRHLVRRGNIVIYPRYQANIKTKLDDMTPGALHAVQAAYTLLKTEGPVRPATGKLAIVGHSMGGFVAANLAALASANGLPAPGALMIIEPGDGEGRMRKLGERLKLVDMSTVPDSTLTLLVTGDADTVVGDKGASKIWEELGRSHVAAKAYITVAADQRSMPKDAADHMAPLAVDESFDPEFALHRPGTTEDDAVGKKKGFFARRREAREHRLINRTRDRWADRFKPDAMDYDGYWRMLDDLLDAAFAGSNSALDQDAGRKWSDRFDEEQKPGMPRIVKRFR